MPKNSRRNRKNKKRGVGSIMVPKEREGYQTGGEAETAEGGMPRENKETGGLPLGSLKELEKLLTFVESGQLKLPDKQQEDAEKSMKNLIEHRKFLDKENKRKGKQEGGMPSEGLMAMPQEIPEESIEESVDEVPVDTYANATPEEIEAEQEPDEVMEEEYIGFDLNEALVPEEQEYLMQILEGDPKLSQIFDKVVDTASEFTGAGEVTGPGNGISDSIPARLSDGEFVMTKKATEELGADNLQTMMDDAERAYDGGMMRKNRYLGGVMSRNEDNLELEDSTGDDIRKLMSIKANKTPSLR